MIQQNPTEFCGHREQYYREYLDAVDNVFGKIFRLFRLREKAKLSGQWQGELQAAALPALPEIWKHNA